MTTDLQRPLVSFVVSVYNLERYIGECLDSILAQPFDDYEIVLVNNNSTDGSDTICRDYASRQKRIRYFALDGEPVFGRAFRYGVAAALGEYVHIVDGDDMLMPGAYREIADVLRREEPDVLFGGFETFSDGFALNFTDTPYSREQINDNGIDAALTYLADRLPLHLTIWRLITKRDLQERREQRFKFYAEIDKQAARTFPVNYDIFCNNTYLVLAHTLRYVEYPIYRYRLRGSSISRIPVSRQAVEACLTLMMHAELVRLEWISEHKKNYVLENMDAWHYSLSVALCVIDSEGLQQCANIINEYACVFPKWDGVSQFDNRHPFVCASLAGDMKGGLERLMEASKETVESVGAKLSRRQGDIYLTPTGNVGANMKRALESCGITISGFFDNDEKKDGVLLDGVSIRLPSAAADTDRPMTVVVASMYANVRQDLKQQFISLGVDESDIAVIEF